MSSRPGLSFSAMRRTADVALFDPGALAVPVPMPQWEAIAPAGPPTGLAARFGGMARYERQLAAARRTYADAVAQQQQAEAERMRRLEAARAEYTRATSEIRRQVAEHNAAVDAWEAAFRAGEPEAVEDYIEQVLAQAVYPSGFPTQRRIAYRPEPRELWVEADLPDRSVIPDERGFRYVKIRKAIEPLPRAERDTKQLYASVIAQTALRMLRECFAADCADLVDVVAFNGHVTTRDSATGKQIHPCLISVSANRATFDELELAHVKSVNCLNRLEAIVSPHPYDLVAVPPVVEFDLARYKFIDEFDAATELDGRFDLLKMDPFKFEHLVKQLFEKIGFKSWVTQASRDDGIDARCCPRGSATRRCMRHPGQTLQARGGGRRGPRPLGSHGGQARHQGHSGDDRLVRQRRPSVRRQPRRTPAAHRGRRTQTPPRRISGSGRANRP